MEFVDWDRTIAGLNSAALALRKRGDAMGDEVGLPKPLMIAGAGVGEDDGELFGYDIAGPAKGVIGRRKDWARGEEGPKEGVPGRDDRYEYTELREVGREGRLIGVKNRKGT
jgi:hypothetical protein